MMCIISVDRTLRHSHRQTSPNTASVWGLCGNTHTLQLKKKVLTFQYMANLNKIVADIMAYDGTNDNPFSKGDRKAVCFACVRVCVRACVCACVRTS
jgi:hypothetical protein